MLRCGNGYIGFQTLQISQAFKEIIPEPPSSWSGKYNLYEIDFYNLDDCTIVINNQAEIFIYAGKGYRTRYIDNPIRSFKIKEETVRFTFNGKY